MTAQPDRPDKRRGPADELGPKQIQLIRSSYAIMGQKGVNQLALQDIADDAGVSKALLLYHFKTRESLILATLDWVLRRVAERIKAAIAPVATGEAKVEAMIDTIFIRPDLNRHFYLVYCDLLGYAARLESFSAIATTFHDTVNQMYADVVALGMREGVFVERSPDEAAEAVRALIDGTFLQWLLEHNWEDTHGRYREQCKRAIMAYLRAR